MRSTRNGLAARHHTSRAPDSVSERHELAADARRRALYARAAPVEASGPREGAAAVEPNEREGAAPG